MIILNKLRKKIVELVYKSGEGHIPSSFSIIDIIYYIYKNKLKKKDHFILSKGHGALALYVVLNHFKIISSKVLNLYYKNNTLIGGHPENNLKGISASTGSLGHGFPTAVGLSLGLKIKKKLNDRVYCLIGDGECNEGAIWESANIAANLNLNNLICLLDDNKSSKNLLPIDNLNLKWKAFGWNVVNSNGHSLKSITYAFKKLDNFRNKKPSIVIFSTVKGKGINFMENNGKWHHKVPSFLELKKINKILAKR